MNFLFYVGIIVPTVITIALFIIFIYCWFLQKARKEVLTRKYDPHGKMRRLGMSMNPPPPPTFRLMEEVLLPEIGEDNIAYDVSRSPSTEQDGRGRPMYKTFHDSGISAGWSPGHDSETRLSLVYRSCPDSGLSGSVSQSGQSGHHVSRGCCDMDELPQRQPQLQQVCGDQILIHARQQQQHQQLDHHSDVPASVYPYPGVCYGDNMDAPSTPQHYHSLLTHPTSLSITDYKDRRTNLTTHTHIPPPHSSQPHRQSTLSVFPASTDQQSRHNIDQLFYHGNQTTQTLHTSPLHDQLSRRNKAVSSEHPSPSMPPTVHFHLQPPLGITDHQNDLPSSPTRPLRHSCRDSGVMDICQPIPVGAERPDSQASQSSTTDSEDSGFRSSYCAAHRNAVLSKQGNPLLKPLRKAINSRSNSKPSKKATSNAGSRRTNHPTSLITLNPQNLEPHVNNSNVIGSSSRSGQQRPHRSVNILQQRASVTSSASSCPSQSGAALTFSNDSPTNSHQHSSPQEIWPPRCSNNKETSVSQTIGLTDISTHLSWKYLQNISPTNKSLSGLPDIGIVLDACNQGVKPGSSHQISRDQHTDTYGYSVV